MTEATIVEETERLMQSLAEGMTAPANRECLVCFTRRMLVEFGGDETLRFAIRYRDLRVPRATALGQRLGCKGGFCDCEILLNAYTRPPHRRPVDEERGETVVVPCAGVRAGSTQACAGWVPRHATDSGSPTVHRSG
jgi:hypothetical protein